ncbi:hypothetical protein PVAG01_01266 [Phlyctema vagabunda]|uniref:Uncharacterized protein n=1 Tax=Phlyctema vagabunda TaxID=108571 RepID=A0ABR4PWL4_9HELO
MASRSSYEEPTTPTEIPATPQLPAADLPDITQTSPTTSTLVAGVSSQPLPPDLSNMVKDALHRSLTPPPSTQYTSRQQGRDTPTASMLSSPPATVATGLARHNTNFIAHTNVSEEYLKEASADELRDLVRNLSANGAKQDALLAESRMNIAHLNLQMNMLSAEKESELQRMEVEHNMTKCEVRMLSRARSDVNTPGSSLLTNYIKLDEKHQALADMAEALRHRLDRAKKIIVAKDDEITDLRESNQMYRKRIQEKHDLYHALRSPGGPYHSSNLKTPTGSNPNTPQQHQSTPKRTPMTGRVEREEPFAALLLADRVLSQENNSAPSTPIIARRTEPRTPIRHHRGAQSLSALQITPNSSQPMPVNSSLLPSAQFHPQHDREHRRRESRDSTISAPDAEEIARAALSSFCEESEEINESQASQTATEMLRVDPREFFEVAASRTGTPVPSDKTAPPKKMYHNVTKAAMEKRKLADDSGVPSAKKVRMNGDIGLGIGFGSPRT